MTSNRNLVNTFNSSIDNGMSSTVINNQMKILVFKTNIKTKKELSLVRPSLNRQSQILKWTVDNNDIDNVLRIETDGKLTEQEVIRLVKSSGLYCEALPD